MQTALITGASVGIGKAIAIRLAEQGYQLVLLARREEKLKQLQHELGHKVPVHLIACDINKHDQLDVALNQLPSNFTEINVLINNAGLALGLDKAHQASWQDWQTMIETNCLSLAYLTRLLLPAMQERDCGHIINIGSTAGTYSYLGANVYGATKAFVEQFSINLKTDLLGSQVRVSNIAPGMLGDTEFSLVRFHGDQIQAKSVYDDTEALKPEDVAEAVQWVLNQPAHVNINKVELMPTCQAPAGLTVSKMNETH